MLEDIRTCSKCGLCNNQRPLLDSERPCQVFWVGLSAKKITSEEERPLSEQTNDILADPITTRFLPSEDERR